MTARWRPVVGFEGCYEVSDLGGVRSVDRYVRCRGAKRRLVRGQPCAPWATKGGRRRVELRRPGAARRVSVGQLVLEAFVGPCPPGQECCHGDGDASNDALTNLRWDTRESNQTDAVRHGTHAQTAKAACPAEHPYDEENTLVTRHGRRCRTCNRDRLRTRRAARAVA